MDRDPSTTLRLVRADVPVETLATEEPAAGSYTAALAQMGVAIQRLGRIHATEGFMAQRRACAESNGGRLNELQRMLEWLEGDLHHPLRDDSEECSFLRGICSADPALPY